jgi:hypothetical protein
MTTKQKIEVAFLDNPVGFTLRRRDELIAHRNRCHRSILKCKKCALLRVHEDFANASNALNLAQLAGVPMKDIFDTAMGVALGGK